MPMPTEIRTTKKPPMEMTNNQSCASGFQWIPQSYRCEDIDECNGKCAIVKNITKSMAKFRLFLIQLQIRLHANMNAAIWLALSIAFAPPVTYWIQLAKVAAWMWMNVPSPAAMAQSHVPRMNFALINLALLHALPVRVQPDSNWIRQSKK
jgi:hypothetical protein